MAQSGFMLTASTVVVENLYSGWYPSKSDKQAYYDPSTYKKVTGEKVIAGVRYEFSGDGKFEGEVVVSGKFKGVDVSKYQGNINWNQVKASGSSLPSSGWAPRLRHRRAGGGPDFRQNIRAPPRRA